MGVRRYKYFLILLIPTPLVSAVFLQQHPYFVHFLNVFSLFIGNRICINRPQATNRNFSLRTILALERRKI